MYLHELDLKPGDLFKRKNHRAYWEVFQNGKMMFCCVEPGDLIADDWENVKTIITTMPTGEKDFNENHPELLPGEELLTNGAGHLESYRRLTEYPQNKHLDPTTLRQGVIAYDTSGGEIDGLRPFFIKPKVKTSVYEQSYLKTLEVAVDKLIGKILEHDLLSCPNPDFKLEPMNCWTECPYFEGFISNKVCWKRWALKGQNDKQGIPEEIKTMQFTEDFTLSETVLSHKKYHQCHECKGTGKKWIKGREYVCLSCMGKNK